jgi:pyruvate/2-oxoglutarate dehydrogenase complex dihydrolipoamide dehydrogenase (E3) component/rhodanese-related sulfurtransferase
MEMTENLHARGIQVTVVERLPQVMPLLDPEMVAPIHDTLVKHGIDLYLNNGVARFEKGEGHRLRATLNDGKHVETDLVILCIGVKPHISLAQNAGLTIGQGGGIQVDARMRTSDPYIWAVGDAVEVEDVITGQRGAVPLAGPANRQGRIAADTIMGRDSTFRGVQGTSVVGVLDHVVAFTGASEKTLKRLGMWEQMEKVYLHPGHHAGYYPGAEPISFKLIFAKADGRIVGAQAVGQKGVEKRIDVIAMAIQKQATVFDLEETELCYAPQFGSAKDPINMAGMIAANVLRGDAKLAHWEQVETSDAFFLDVRDPSEFNQDHLEEAVNIPLDELRRRMNELPNDREIWTYCYVGQRAYFAARALAQYGFEVRNISGGFKSFLLQEGHKYL